VAGAARSQEHPRRNLPCWLVYLLVLGFFLTLRGYHSFDGDQAYRLPLLLHRQDPSLYADDPFVRAFDTFNPHRGALMVLDLVTRPLGLPGGLFVLFLFTFGATCVGIHRLARVAWPEAGNKVSLLAVSLVLAAKAGNIGTNHLFEAMVLDRLIAFSLSWLALANLVADPRRHTWWTPCAIGLATLIHPSVGLQLALLLGACWLTWSLLGRWTEASFPAASRGVASLVVAVIPGLIVNFNTASALVSGMPADVFWLLSVELQSPQHMLPHLWRMPQWLGWASYFALAAMACAAMRSEQETRRSCSSPEHGFVSPALPPARARLIIALVLILAGLAVAWVFIEVRHHVRVTVFQPFRMATVARGIALLLVAGRLMALWQSGTWLGRQRALLIAVGFIGDWLLVVVTLSELAISIVEAIPFRMRWFPRWDILETAVFLLMMALGLNFLGHHDTEYGHIPLLLALGTGLLIGIVGHRGHERFLSRSLRADWTALRLGGALALAWFVPLAALLAAAIPWNHPWSRSSLVATLLNRCRFTEVPVDDVERLALWCQENTPASARFIAPPGPKTFRLWSLRNLAFNRSASPYHAAGLADWYARFQDHVDIHVAPAEFVRAYVRDRHRFEARYDAQSDAQRAALAIRQGASYVVAAVPRARAQQIGPPRALEREKDLESFGPLELLHVEGRYAVYRVKFDALVQHQR